MNSITVRYDSAPIRAVERTPQGGLRVPAYVTRVGILEYTRADGTICKEFRPADEVFHVDSLATLYGAPVTVGHPGQVSPDNWQTHAVGHSEAATPTDEYVSASLRVQRKDAVEAIQAGTLCEVSCGYTVTIDPTPGTFEGKSYDVVQRNIRYNHVALGPKKWGRAGENVRLRLDAAGAQMYAFSMEEDKIKEAAAAAKAAMALREDAHQGAIEKMKAEVDAAKAEIAALRASFPLVVASRIALVTRAAKIMGDSYRSDGKTLREIACECVAKRDESFRSDGKSDEYVMGRFDALSTVDAAASLAQIKQDAGQSLQVEKTREQLAIERSANLHRVPLWERK